MSSDSQQTAQNAQTFATASGNGQQQRAELVSELTRELQQFTGLSASFFRAAAAQRGLTVTDMQVLDILERTGPTIAGQLADLTGLTTGAITGMLNRLEEAKLVRRERDPNDGRRVIIELASDNTALGRRDSTSILASFGRAWDSIIASYDDEQLALLLGFIQRSNTLAAQEIVRLREVSEDDGKVLTAPLDGLTSGRLVISSGISRLRVSASDSMTDLFQARFEGVQPEMKVKDGAITIRYPRRLWPLDREQRAAEVALNRTIPWWIVIQGGAAEVIAKLGQLNLAGLEAKGGLSMIELELPPPTAVVPILISGGASQITIRRPQSVAAQAHLKGWASTFIFDDQTFGNVGNDVRLQSQGYDAATNRYDIEVASSVSMVTITTIGSDVD